MIKWFLYLRLLLGKAYETLRESGIIELPSQRTLRDYTHYCRTAIGFLHEIDQNLVEVADLSQNLHKYVVLIIDEMHIKEELVYDKHEGCLSVTVGQHLEALYCQDTESEEGLRLVPKQAHIFVIIFKNACRPCCTSKQFAFCISPHIPYTL